MNKNKEDASRDFAKNLVRTKFEDIPLDVVENTKRDIFDTMGCALAGSSLHGISEMMDLMTEWGGKQEATVWVFGNKMPCINAALINGSMAHARDFDDTYDLGLIHVGVSTIPAAIAAAERVDRISGKD